MATATLEKQAVLYRMVMPKSICPSGLKAKALLEREGYTVDDRWLRSRDDVDALKTELDVKTTPQIVINGTRIGGYTDTLEHLGKTIPDPKAKTYKPVIALFAVAALLSLLLNFSSFSSDPAASLIRFIEQFIAGSMILLGLQKLRDLESFATQFLGYDLLAQRRVRYAYVYPFAETGAGLLMFAGLLPWLAAPVGLFISTIGAASVYKAVYVDKRELKCACVGGNSNVPLGFVSLTENLMMMGMAIWMLIKFVL
ncbi:MAG: MauE/DoxX family redox-associated membrane protein [Alphaproteobacteria bacterium]